MRTCTCYAVVCRNGVALIKCGMCATTPGTPHYASPCFSALAIGPLHPGVYALAPVRSALASALAPNKAKAAA